MSSRGKAVIDSRFSLQIPDTFVASKRTATLGTLYVAGNYPRFTVVSVTAWPLTKLLADDAVAQTLPGLPLPQPRKAALPGSSLSELGSPMEIGRLLLRARDREASSGAVQSELLDADLQQASLRWSFDTPLPVSDPDALEKERGVRRLIRRTAARSIIGEVPSAAGGTESAIISVWASALQQDWEKGLGLELQECVSSFSWTATS
uniref:Uncharacterized protein n=1 Tax=Calcidiscus leptoporus TaxID=127549 RepID=A0A7S0P3G6_9EUKA